MNRSIHHNFLLAIGLVGLCCASTTVSGQTPPGIDEIFKKWAEREATIRSLRVSWSEDIHYARGFMSRMFPGEYKGEVPPEDYDYTRSSVVTLDHEKMRYEYPRRTWSEAKAVFIDDRTLTTFDGAIVHRLTTSATSHPTGHIRHAPAHIESGSMHARPILGLYRALGGANSPYRGRSIEKSGKMLPIHGNSCLELRLSASESSSESIWVDISHDFLPVLVQVIDHGIQLWRLEIWYAKGGQGQWALDNWTLVHTNRDGTLRYSARAKVTSWEIDCATSAGDFDIAFPVGTYVSDNRSRSHFIQTDTDTVRDVPERERQKPYEELIQAVAPSRRFRPPYWWLLMGGASLIGLGFLVYRRKSKRQTNT